MSYEGYVQLLCPKGHLWNVDCYQEDELAHLDAELKQENKPPVNLVCPFCKQPPMWRNGVDETNGDAYGYIELEVDKPSVICKCDKCGIEHTVDPETYKIPGSDAREKAIDKWEKEQEAFIKEMEMRQKELHKMDPKPCPDCGKQWDCACDQPA
jgi:hypothetical protein